MTPQLRPYQNDALGRLDAAFNAGRRAPLLAAPTGSGKTVIAAELIRRETAAGRRVLFVAPRRELIHQCSDKLRAFGVPHGVLLAGDPRRNLGALAQVASIDTLRARLDRLPLPDPDLLVVDEAHLYVTRIRVGLLESWPAARRVGLTATPARKDGRGLRLLFDELIEVATVPELMRLGFLVPARYFSIAEPDLARVHTVAGDYHVGELAEAVNPLVADVPTTWLQRAPGRRTAVFAVNVKHSVALRDAFLQHGVAAEHVDGDMPTREREAAFDRFRDGRTQVLTNCQLASYGFDLPELDCVVLARPTRSLVLYLQMIGRGLRPADGKADCLVLDHSGCVHRHGFAHEERLWTLDGHAELTVEARQRSTSTEHKQLTCPDCACVFSGTRTCPSCGYYFEPKGKLVRTLDGELVEFGATATTDTKERMAFYVELMGYAAKHKFKTGWAAHKFKERFDTFPPWAWNDLPAAEPSLETSRWITSRWIAWKKSRPMQEAAR
jgi:superfamily II DNA or RNA helicase